MSLQEWFTPARTGWGCVCVVVISASQLLFSLWLSPQPFVNNLGFCQRCGRECELFWKKTSWNKLLWLVYRINKDDKKTRNATPGCSYKWEIEPEGLGRSSLHVIPRSWWELCSPSCCFPSLQQHSLAEQLFPAVCVPEQTLAGEKIWGNEYSVCFC